MYRDLGHIYCLDSMLYVHQNWITCCLSPPFALRMTIPRNKTEAINKFKLPRPLDRRVVLTPEVEAAIRAEYIPYVVSQNTLAKKYGISKRLVSFVLHPEKRQACAEQFKQRREDGRYKPSKEKWRKTMAEHRSYKYLALANGIPANQ